MDCHNLLGCGIFNLWNKIFRGCGNPENGFKLFVCKGCHDVRRVLYRCKGRFCTTCSVGESEEWSRLLAEDVLQVNHRHVIFTIDEGLQDVFLLHRHLLKDFMDKAARILVEFFQKKAKITPGIIAGLHTFGSKVNFNPHVHLLVTMGGMTKKENGRAMISYPYKIKKMKMIERDFIINKIKHKFDNLFKEGSRFSKTTENCMEDALWCF